MIHIYIYKIMYYLLLGLSQIV